MHNPTKLLEDSGWFARNCPLSFPLEWQHRHGYRICEYWLGAPERPEWYCSILYNGQHWVKPGRFDDAVAIAQSLAEATPPVQLSLLG